MKTMIEVWVYKHSAAGCRFLLLKRTKDNGGFWQPVVGKLEDDEQPVTGARRELREEIGLRDTMHISEKLYEFTIDKHYKTGERIAPQIEYCYAIEVSPDTLIDITKNPDAEHDTYLWATYEEAMTLLRWDNNKDALRAIAIQRKL